MEITDWGLIDYHEAWRLQRELVETIVHSGGLDTLVLCEHPPVITLGRTTQKGSVLADRGSLHARHIDVVEIDRGGEATVHSPGQLVGYPIFNLNRHNPDLHWFLRTVEQCVIDALAHYGVSGGRVDGLTGVWVGNTRKICAIGLHCSRWVTSHGFALNVNNDLAMFDMIVPCGIQDRGVTSLVLETGSQIDLADVKEQVVSAFRNHFQKNT